MIYLILAIGCSSGVALAIRYAQKHCDNMQSVTGVNYLICIVFCFFSLGNKSVLPANSGQGFSLLLGLLNGSLYLCTMLLMQFNIKKNGTTISTSFSHLGVLVPTVASIFVFREYPEMIQWVGVILAIIAILIINYEGKEAYQNTHARMILVILLISGGCTDMMSKVFEVYGNHKDEGYFLFYTFCIAFLLNTVLAVCQRASLTFADVKGGILLGGFNYLSSLLLLRAVMRLPAFLVYPAYSVGVIICVNVVNFIFMKEPLKKKEYVGMAIIAAALVFMNI